MTSRVPCGFRNPLRSATIRRMPLPSAVTPGSLGGVATRHRGGPRGIALAAVAAAVVVVAAAAVESWTGAASFAPMLLVVAVTTVLWGWMPGVAAIVVSLAGGVLFVLPPRGDVTLPLSDAVFAAIWGLTAVVIVVLGVAFREARHRAARNAEALVAESRRFQAAQELAPDGFAVLRADARGRMVWSYANAAVGRMLGRDPAALVGTPLDPAGDPALDGLAEAVAAAAEEPWHGELWIDRDGTRTWLSTSASRLDDGIAVNLSDVTAQHAAAAHERLLADLGVIINAPLRTDERLDRLAARLLPEIADSCVVDLCDEGGVLRRVAVHHVDPELRAQILALGDPLPTAPVSRVADTGEPLLIEEVGDVHTEASSRDAAEAELRRGIGTRSALIVPLIARERCIGTLALSTMRGASNRRLGRLELVRAEQIARRVALAVDNAELFNAAREAGERLGFLAEASRTLAGSLDMQQTLEALVGLAVPRLGDRAAVELVHPGRALETPAATGSTEPGRASVTRAPLRVRGETFGALVLTRGESRGPLRPEDEELLQELAARGATAIDNARLFSQTQSVAETLQRSLIPPELPQPPGARVGATYLPMGDGIQAGGDFYDLFPSTGDDWFLAVGDVCGKGERAAALTALARYTLRALAPFHPEPEDLVRELNSAVIRQRRGSTRFLTLALARLRPCEDGFAVRLVLAGHPPAVVGRAGDVSETAGTPGSLIGVWEDLSLAPDDLVLGPGDRLIMVTDGVLEAGRRSAPFGEAGLMAFARDLDGLSPGRIAGAVADAARRHAGGVLRDDVAVVVVETGSPLVAVRLPARRESARRARTVAVEAARRAGVPEERLPDVALAVSEAVTNAIRHGWSAGGEEEIVDLTAVVGDDGLELVVRDGGRGLEAPTLDPGLGVGMDLIRTLAEEVSFESTLGEGTVVRMRFPVAG